MSVRRAMKQAVVEYLGANDGWLPEHIAITGTGGKPRPNCGDWFVGVWGAQRQWNMTTAAQVSMSVNVTLTQRFNGPVDRWDVALDELEEGFDERMDHLASILFAGQNEIRARADDLMPAGLGGFVEAPHPIYDSEPEPVRADWFHSSDDGGRNQGDGNLYGFKSTLLYGGWTFIHPVSLARL